MSSAYAVVVRVDGTVERFDRPVSLAEVASVLGDVHLAAYTIRSPCPPLVPLAMLVNDDGWAVAAPFNPAATALYHQGASPVLGDVAITGDDGPLAAEHVAAIVATAEAHAT